ncbi:hypothetical protein AMECASPLE_003145 [Ameca splendens]|uniref:Uncharacterized protein n=1 Tax=Ameca splendens TaxID=208324 RepID=A0ABV0YLR3_9TELE
MSSESSDGAAFVVTLKWDSSGGLFALGLDVGRYFTFYSKQGINTERAHLNTCPRCAKQNEVQQRSLRGCSKVEQLRAINCPLMPHSYKGGGIAAQLNTTCS